MAKLAIKGHQERGSEVIQVLEMFGGINKYDAKGDYEAGFYFISDKGIIESSALRNININSEYVLYTLEKFEKAFPYKKGDSVCFSTGAWQVDISAIKDIEWDSQSAQVIYTTDNSYTRYAYELKPCPSMTDLPLREEPLPPMKLYKVFIDTFQFGYKFYTLFVKADSEQSMRRVVLDKIANDKNAVIYHVEEIDLDSRTCCIL